MAHPETQGAAAASAKEKAAENALEAIEAQVQLEKQLTEGFPTDPAEFPDDPRVSLSKADNKYILVDDEGEEWEFDEIHRKWIMADIDDELGGQRLDDSEDRLSGGVGGSSKPSDGEALSGNDLAGTNGGPFKSEEDRERAKEEKKRKKLAHRENLKRKREEEIAKRPPTAIYIQNLPLDTTEEELSKFCGKCGIIAMSESGKERITIHHVKDAEGKDTDQQKGDATVVFLKPESVSLALMLLDDTYFRPTLSERVQVSVAQSDFKKVKTEEYKQRVRAPESAKDRQKRLKLRQLQEAKLADWSDDEPGHVDVDEERRKAKHAKTVVLKNCFRLWDMENDPEEYATVREDMFEGCGAHGELTNVTIYDLEPDGVVTVKFKTVEQAQSCAARMNGRMYAGRTLVAYLSDGSERFRKSNDRQGEEERLEAFSKSLEAGEGGSAEA